MKAVEPTAEIGDAPRVLPRKMVNLLLQLKMLMPVPLKRKKLKAELLELMPLVRTAATETDSAPKQPDHRPLVDREDKTLLLQPLLQPIHSLKTHQQEVMMEDNKESQ